MISDVAELPDDVETLKAMVVAARAETAKLQAAKADASLLGSPTRRKRLCHR